MGKKVDITGRRFGRLVAVSETDIYAQRSKKWLCLCQCGEYATVDKRKLISGHTKSCGCLVIDKTVSMSLKHGMCGSSLYTIYKNMLARCCNPKSNNYKNYGGRGIKICKRWLDSFENFYADMGDRPKGKTLDRIDNDGDYCPENCQWSTMHQQQRNKRNNLIIEYDGERMCLKDWAKKIGIHSTSLKERIVNWGVKKALTTPPRIGNWHGQKNKQGFE